MAHCFVTGATGFIGARLVARLREAGDRVTCLVRPATRAEKLQELGAEIRRGDVATGDGLAAAVADCDVVYHVAGLVKARSRQELFRTNGDGPAQVVEACARRTSPPTLVYVSSLAVMGPATVDRAWDVADEPRPISNYGRSKLAGETAVRRRAADVPTTIVRPPIVFGPGDPVTFAWFQGLSRWKLHAIPCDTSWRYSLVYVDDLITGLIEAGRRGRRIGAADDTAETRSTGVYFVAHDEASTYGQIGQLAADGLGLQRFRSWRVPKPVIWAGAVGSELVSRACGKPPFFSIDKAREATAGSWICSGTAARRDFDWAPSAALGEQFRDTADWYLRHGWLAK